MNNLFDRLPLTSPQESIDVLVQNGNVRIERIVSTGQSSPDRFWYDQDEAEWVVLLQGEAELRFQDGSEPLRMKKGDFVHLAAHRKHRVEWTSDREPTVWLAVFYSDPTDTPSD